METKNKMYLIILGIVAAVILAILAFIGIMVGVSLKSLTTQEREFINKIRFQPVLFSLSVRLQSLAHQPLPPHGREGLACETIRLPSPVK